MNKVNNRVVNINTAELGRRLNISQQYAYLIVTGQRPGKKYQKRIHRFIKSETRKLAAAA